MNCGEYERSLTECLGDDGPRRCAGLTRLREHAASCAACSGTLPLLDLLALPEAERDIAADPGAEYWSRFDARLQQRIAAEQAPAESARGPVMRRVLPAAAAVLLAAAGIWFAMQGPRPDPAVGSAGTAAATVADDLPATLAAGLRELSSDELDGHLDVLTGWELAWDAASEDTAGPGRGSEGLFPDPAGLAPEQRRALLDWLRQEASRPRGAQG